MKKLFVTVLGVSAALSLLAADEDPFKSRKDKVSYMLGMNYGKMLKQNDVEIDFDQLIKGIKDTAAGKTLPTADQAGTINKEFGQEVQAKVMEKRKAEGEKNKKAGEAFLAENKKKEGVQTTASGLQYKIETKGTGKLPAATDTVVCNYRGTLSDGT